MTDSADAIAGLVLLIGWHGGRFPLYYDGAETSSKWLEGSPGVVAPKLAGLAERLDFKNSTQIELGLPHAKGVGLRKVTVLWAWCESREQVRRAVRFRPAPAYVLRMGSSCRRLLLWGLREEIPEIDAERDNKRIAYRLSAPQKYAVPGNLRIPVPGTFLRVGRKRPAPVLVTRSTIEAHWRTQVTARLKDPPAPFMQRVREGTAKIR